MCSFGIGQLFPSPLPLPLFAFPLPLPFPFPFPFSSSSFLFFLFYSSLQIKIPLGSADGITSLGTLIRPSQRAGEQCSLRRGEGQIGGRCPLGLRNTLNQLYVVFILK